MTMTHDLAATAVVSIAAAMIAVLAAVSDAVAGAAIAGVFSVVNTVIGALLIREQRRTRRDIERPRRILYDANGKPVGFVLDGPDLDAIQEAMR